MPDWLTKAGRALFFVYKNHGGRAWETKQSCFVLVDMARMPGRRNDPVSSSLRKQVREGAFRMLEVFHSISTRTKRGRFVSQAFTPFRRWNASSTRTKRGRFVSQSTQRIIPFL